MSDDGKVSLENCDFTKKKNRLTSPHSLMACELIGVTEEDLTKITLEEYIRKFPESQYLQKELQEERYNHYEESRQKLIDEAKQKREELMKEEEDPKNKTKRTLYDSGFNPNESLALSKSSNYKTINAKKSSSVGSMNMTSSAEQSTAIKAEREKLKKMKERQEINIKLQIDYECTLEENRRNNLRKMRMKAMKEEKKRKEKERLQQEKNKREQEKEMERKKKEEEYHQKMEEKR